MSDSNNLASFLSSFRSLSPVSGPAADPQSARKAVFTLTFNDNGQPMVCPDSATRDNVASLDAAGQRAMREYNRISQSSNSFGTVWSNQPEGGVSLWENPYILSLLQNCRLFDKFTGNYLEFSDSPAVLKLQLITTSDDSDVTPLLTVTSGDNTSGSVRFLSESMVLSDGKIFITDPVGENFTRIASLISTIPRNQLEPYLSLFLSFFENITPVLNGKQARFLPSPEPAIPTIILEKVASDRALYLRTATTVGTLSDEFSSSVAISRIATVTDDGEVEVRAVAHSDLASHTDRLESLVLSSAPSRQARKDVYRDNSFFIIPAETASPFLINHLAEILRDFRLVGSEKLRDYKLTAAFPKLSLKLSSGIDFLEGDAEVDVEGEKFSIGDLLDQYARNRYIRLSDGNRAIIDEKYINRLNRLFALRDKKGHIKVSFFDLPEVEELINERISGTFATRTRKVFEGFNKLAKSKIPPVKVGATLRAYQKEGVKWIDYLYHNNLGGCLADDMGLGKTLQTIAILSTLYPGTDSPSLIVMPRSLLFNWEKEFERFAPQISTATYYGTDRDLDAALRADVVITTYAMIRNDIEKLKDVAFHYVILDESQNIKNVSSQTAVAVTLLRARHRLALSGTPIENNLTELYSLFRFLNPPMFGSLEEFNAAYTYPIQKSGDSEAMQSLRRKIYPFILRRLKRDVLTELPDRIDRTLYIEMSPEQKKFYEDRRIAYRKEIQEAVAKSGIGKSQFVIFQALNELRRIASVPESLSDGRVKSPKIAELVENLEETVGNGHKTVVFFNYIAGLDLVGARLQKLGIDFETMTGSTTAAARKRIVERFQADPKCMVLLMTLKVGGVGLNLTAADTVFIVEPWWNKAAEEQAVNRLHRIGQKASVVSCSLITEGSIEEKILLLQQKKSELFDNLISEDSASSKQLSEDDINFILS